jgi:DNA-binding NtrC family response regulator
MTRILIIDDNQSILNFLNILLLQTGKFEIETLQESSRAFEVLDRKEHDILLLDMDMPEVSGMDILNYIHKNRLSITTIVLTGVEDIDLAISAMKLGTFDYLLKPIEEDRLMDALEVAARDISLDEPEKKTTLSVDSLENKEVFDEIITQDESMIKIFHFVEKYAHTDNSVLIWGESGTGKELIAQAIHKISNRRDKKFVAINAGAFAQELFSSEFFGYEKGAFTGANTTKKGFIEEANGGTLFLDEIGELELPIQVKLLRVLQEEEFYKLGSTKNIKIDVRIIAATNKNLFEEINRGNFRKDLFFRLNINSISLPPLRERPEDIPLLAQYFLNKFNKKYKRSIKKISNPVISCLKSYSFPGNVRELMNIINSSMIVETTNELRRKSLPNYFLDHHDQNGFEEGIQPGSLEDMEKEHIRKVLIFTGNNKTKAASILGISRVNLNAKIKKYELS